MSLLNLPDDKIYEICEQLDLQSLSSLIQTTSRVYNLCKNLIVDKYIEKKRPKIPNFPYFPVKEYLEDIGYILEIDEGDPELDYIYPIIVNDPRTKVTGKLFAEAFKQNLFNTIKTLLISGKIDPNDPEIFENIKPYDDKYSVGHQIIEAIVEDPRTTPESRQEYEERFLASYSLDYDINKPQFREFNLYKYGFQPKDIRKVSEDIELTDEIIAEAGPESASEWINVYLKNIQHPTAEDYLIFIRMNPTPEQKREFFDRFTPEYKDFRYFIRAGLSPEDIKEFISKMTPEEQISLRSKLYLN